MIKQREYSIVARSYAQALFNGARKQGILQRVQEEARFLLATMNATRERVPKIAQFLASPQIDTEKKVEVLAKAFQGRLSPIFMKMIELLVRRERIQYLREITELLLELIEQAEGIHHASVESAIELSFQDKLRLKTALEKFTGQKLRIDYEVDPALLGGLVFRFKDMLIDTSIASGLRELKRKLLETQVESAV